MGTVAAPLKGGCGGVISGVAGVESSSPPMYAKEDRLWSAGWTEAGKDWRSST
jgi:hypothetical protein